MGVGRKRRGKKGGKADDDGLLPDEVEAFHEKRDAQRKRETKGLAGFEEDESDDSSSDESMSEEAIMDVDDSSDSDDDSDDYDDDTSESDDEEEKRKRSKRLSSKGLLQSMETQKNLMERKVRSAKESYGSSSDDDSEDEEDEGEGEEDGWGRNKKTYYQKGEVAEDREDEDDDFNAREEEEAEARRMQSKQASRLAESDFDLDDEDDDDEGAKDGSADAAGGLSREDKLAMIEQDAPELSTLLSDLKATLEEVKSAVQPSLDALRSNDPSRTAADAMAKAKAAMQHKNGLSFIESKYSLMLSYCCHIVFYLLMKCEGKPVSDHPLLGRLVEIRTYLEKIRPIEKKMNYQVQKLVTQALKKPVSEAAAAGDAAGRDPLKFRPNPSALTLAENGKSAENGGAADDAYVPPRIAPVHYSEDEDEDDAAEDLELQTRNMQKLLKAKKHERRKALRSEYVQHLVSELGDLPEEIGVDGQTRSGSASAFAQREAARLRVRGEQEEEMLARTPMTKMEKKRLKAAKRSVLTGTTISVLDDLGAADIADFAVDDDPEASGGAKTGARAEMAKYLEEKRRQKKKLRAKDPLHGMPQADGGGHRRSGDEDFPVRSLGDRRARHDSAHARKRARQFDEEDGGGLGAGGEEMYSDGLDDDIEEKYELYSGARHESEAKKEAKRSRKQSKTVMHHPPLEEDRIVGGKREINYQIEKNRGLTPRRNKDLKNPRKKHRIKYNKALIRRKGQVQDQRERRESYGGEATGIKSRVTKSVKL